MQANTHHTSITTWRVLSCALFFVLLSSNDVARAQELGERGNFAFSVERLFGFFIDKQSVETPAGDFDTDYSDFSIGWNNAPTPLTLPRLGFDYFIDESFTIGGNFGVYSLSMETDPGGEVSQTGVLFGARVGYALRLGHAVSFWPRAGLSFSTLNSDGTGADRDQFALDIEGMFSLSPAEGWSFLVGPTIDIGFAGEAGNNDLSETCFGVMFGMLGYFGT